MTRALAWWLLVLTLAACDDTTGGPAAGEGDADPTVDAAGTLDGAGGEDTAAPGDSTATTADASDAKGDAKVVQLGCGGDGDCAALVLSDCQKAACNPTSRLCEVVALPDDATCLNEVASACVVSRTCQAGQCVTVKKACDDGKLCTKDLCDDVVGCKSETFASLCNDGNLCTDGDKCLGDECKGGQAVSCDDKLACTTDACDPKVGCTHAPVANGGPCDDGLFCVVDEACQAGKCTGKAVDCPDKDGDPCTIEGCAEVLKGCAPQPLDDLVCDDGDPCTSGDKCTGGTCAGTLAKCDDQNPCTDDSCDKTKGCQNLPNTAPCPLPDACATSAACAGGQCVAKPKVCDDGNQCTQDGCDKVLGCQHVSQPSACWDGDACTVEDTCSGGKCAPGSPLVCDDKNPCSVDTCDKKTGCVHGPEAPGASCGGGSQCVVGQCLPNTCGDGKCGFSETSSGCEADCPASGGDCAASDGACLAQCNASKCKVQEDACAAVGGCGQLKACVAAAQDLSGQLACFDGVSATTGDAYLALNQCGQAFCVADFWLGKKCTGGGSAYVACVDGCESAMCKLKWLQCKVSAGCTAVRDCMKGCTQGDPTPCISACKAKGTSDDVVLNADLDLCSAKYCQ